jgi:hypothetical protein
VDTGYILCWAIYSPWLYIYHSACLALSFLSLFVHLVLALEMTNKFLVCEMGQCHDTVASLVRTQMSVDLGHFRTPGAPAIDI